MKEIHNQTHTLILASASPRRHEILTAAGIPHLVRPTDADETLPEGISPADAVELLSARKARAALAGAQEGSVILAADTVVSLGDRILGKPHGAKEARVMLLSLSGRAHEVFTGVTLCSAGRMVTAHERTVVHMRPLSGEEIDAYIATGEPLDKAGAYGIQGRGGLFVSGIEGDYFNIVGLPLYRVGRMLCEEFGWTCLLRS
ncbi:MAG: Maf family protein [Eubacteriales bacterium]